MFDELLEDIYEPVKDCNRCPSKLVESQLAWVPTCFLDPIPKIMDVQRAVAGGHDTVSFTIRALGEQDFKHKDRLPIHHLKLNSTEEVIVKRAKRRPCILLSKNRLNDSPELKEQLVGKKKHILTNDMVFLPLYSVQREGSDSGFSLEIYDRIRKMCYSHFIALPDCPSKLGQHPIKKSVVRLDRIFSTACHHHSIIPIDIKLSEEFFLIFIDIVKEHFTGVECPELSEFRQLFQKE